MPDGAFPYLAWDLSPLRPWEFWQADAADWTEAHAVRDAYQDGVADAKDEHEANQELAKGRPE